MFFNYSFAKNHDKRRIEKQMIITTINNCKLFIQFDRIVKTGLIYIFDDAKYEKKRNIANSEFEVIDLPKTIDKIHLEINIENENKIIKTINLKQ
jgi:hypothetical protein